MGSARWCQCLFAGISDVNVCLQESVVGGGPSVWVQQGGVSLLAGISDVNVCVQESVMSVFVYRNQWCQCLFAGINGIDVCLQESVVLMFVYRNQWC